MATTTFHWNIVEHDSEHGRAEYQAKHWNKNQYVPTFSKILYFHLYWSSLIIRNVYYIFRLCQSLYWKLWRYLKQYAQISTDVPSILYYAITTGPITKHSVRSPTWISSTSNSIDNHFHMSKCIFTQINMFAEIFSLIKLIIMKLRIN